MLLSRCWKPENFRTWTPYYDHFWKWKWYVPPHKVGSKFVEESTPKFSAPIQEIEPKHPEPCRLGGIHGYRVVTLTLCARSPLKCGRVSVYPNSEGPRYLKGARGYNCYSPNILEPSSYLFLSPQSNYSALNSNSGRAPLLRVVDYWGTLLCLSILATSVLLSWTGPACALLYSTDLLDNAALHHLLDKAQ